MTSIHSLPVELLARIFFLGLCDDPEPDQQLPGDPTFEVLASHVCQYWRDVALRTPNLWTTIHLRTFPHIDRARHYLARSTRHPLNVIVDTCTEDDYQPGHLLFRDEFLPLFDIVTPHISRWRSLVLKVRDLTCKAHARTVLSTCGAAPILDFLQLWHIEEWGSPERLYTAIGPPPVVVFAGSLPSLRTISLIGVNLPWLHSPFLTGLLSIELALHSDDVRIPFNLWRDMLAHSPDLTRLSLTYSGPRSKTGPWTLPERITLPALVHLRLTDLDPPYLCALLRTIHAPALRTLHLELSDQDFTPFARMLSSPLPAPSADPAANPDEGLTIDPTALPPDLATDPDHEPESASEPGAGPLAALDTLSIAALDCSLASWRALLAGLWEVSVRGRDEAGVALEREMAVRGEGEVLEWFQDEEDEEDEEGEEDEGSEEPHGEEGDESDGAGDAGQL
ncbi:hypothetical protein B0H21DRAFT_777104 [Amylocystis lapponica]|nr:hypothetical protein B0H21DRAFT_777104 [Amylocystis lapponica]